MTKNSVGAFSIPISVYSILDAQWRSQDTDVMWAQHGPKTQLFLAVL